MELVSTVTDALYFLQSPDKYIEPNGFKDTQLELTFDALASFS
jgi:hypothetical protein